MPQLRNNHMLKRHERSRDAWAKHKDLDQYQAKFMYIEALLKVYITFVFAKHFLTKSPQVLRRYSDKTIAMDYVRELDSYTADSSDLELSGELC